MGTFRASDRLAAEELFHACYPRLAGWIRRLVDDDDTAHEIASEAFTRLLARWSSLDNPQSYLYMIATNLIRDHWRRLGRERRALRAVSTTMPAEARIRFVVPMTRTMNAVKLPPKAAPITEPTPRIP